MTEFTMLLENWVEFNVNDKVWVQVTETGHGIARRQYQELGLEYKPKQEDADGWSEWQLHELMWHFGPGMGVPTFDPPIRTGIRLRKDDLTEQETASDTVKFNLTGKPYNPDIAD